MIISTRGWDPVPSACAQVASSAIIVINAHMRRGLETRLGGAGLVKHDMGETGPCKARHGWG